MKERECYAKYSTDVIKKKSHAKRIEKEKKKVRARERAARMGKITDFTRADFACIEGLRLSVIKNAARVTARKSRNYRDRDFALRASA